MANHGYALFSLFTSNPERYHMNIRMGVESIVQQVNDGYEKTLSTSLDGSEKVLISGERISMMTEDELSGLIDFISRHGFEIIPFALVRSPYAFVCSAIQQRIKGGVHVKLISFGWNNHSSDSSFPIPSRMDVVQKLISVWGSQLQLFPFTLACKHEYGPVGFLLEKMNIHDPAKINFRQRNESRSNGWVRLQNQVNKKFPAIKNNKLNPAHFKVAPMIGGKEKFLLTPSELLTVKDQIDRENDHFKAILGDAFCDQSFPTSSPFSSDEISSMLVKLARRSSAVPAKKTAKKATKKTAKKATKKTARKAVANRTKRDCAEGTNNQ